MEDTSQKLDEIQARIRQLEERLRWWRTTVLCLVPVLFIGFFVSAASSQQRGTSFRAPFTVVGPKGENLLVVDMYQKPGSPVYGTSLTLYAAQPGTSQSSPAATLVASGELYKDASDPQENYLNVIETYLYHYDKDAQGKSTVTPYKAYSLGLTRAGGSEILWNLPKTPDAAPTPAARLTAKRDVGGELILSSAQGKEGTTLKP